MKKLYITLALIPFIAVAQNKEGATGLYSPYPSILNEIWVEVCSSANEAACSDNEEGFFVACTRETFCSTVREDQCFYRFYKIEHISKDNSNALTNITHPLPSIKKKMQII
ncbi:MAG: hypothetical protein ACK5MJ_07270 [Alphaproteobacteria bacterium]